MSCILGKPSLGVPYFVLKPLVNVAYAVGRNSFSSHWLVLGRYPFKGSSEKAGKILGWAPRRTALDAFNEMAAEWKRKNG